jgi:homeobox protein ESX1
MSCECFLWCFFPFLEEVFEVASLVPLEAAMPELAESLPELPLDPEVPEPTLPLVPELPEPMLPLEPELPEPMLPLEPEPMLPLEPEPMLPLEPELPDPMLPLEPVLPEPELPMLPLDPELPLPVEPDCANAGTASARTPIKIALPILFPPWSLTLLPTGNLAIRATA